jgi:inorganic triphosphatase YgiF
MNKDYPLEVELKLAFPPEVRAQIEGHPALGGPGAPRSKAGREISTYFDTPDLALHQNGMNLRVRSKGKHRIQTLKLEPGTKRLSAQRAEWEWAIPTGRVNPELLRNTPAASVAAARLQPVTVTDIQRTVRIVKLDGGTIIEASLDEGTIIAGEFSSPVHELELELKEGTPGPLYRLALALHDDLPLRMEPEAKATRGYRLRTGQSAAVQKTSASDLDGQSSIAVAFQQVVDAGVGALTANQPAAAEGDPEGIHQMRIATRRLRTALALFEPFLEHNVTERFESELRRLGQLLGEARDWDVFCLQTLPKALEQPMRAILLPAAEAELKASHTKLKETLAGPDLTGVALGMTGWARDENLLADQAARRLRLADVAPELLDRLARKVAKRGRHIRRRSEADLHRVRKSLKKLRYAGDDLAGLYHPKAVKAFRKQCKDLQERLGTLNDAVVAVTLAKSLVQSGQSDRIPAVWALSGWSQKRLRKVKRRLPAAWAEFRDAPPFWA